MAVRKVRYVALKVSSRAGQGARVLGAVEAAGVNLLAFTGFPDKGGKSQIDLVAEDLGGVRRAARKAGLRLGPAKRAFLVQGGDEVGAAHRVLKKLAARGINVTAADAVTAGKGRFGMILWVKPKDYNRAAAVLGAR
jgi:hypothetical protein